MLGIVSAGILDVASAVCAHLHPLFYVFIPYWTLILVAFSLSPLTILLPQLLQGKLSWPSKEDVAQEWTIHGKKYDLTPFYADHPGGSWALRAAKGSDCTGLFESYHTFIDRDALLRMLARYETQQDGHKAEDAGVVFHDKFYEDLKAMVREYFKGKGKGAHKMTAPHLASGFVAWVCMWSSIYLVLFRGAMWPIPVIGLLSSYLSGHVMHDASHNALVTSPTGNRILSHVGFPYSPNITAWHIQHVMSHHIYTNDETDVDLYHFDPIVTLQSGVGHVHPALHALRLLVILSSAILHLVLVVPYGLLFGQVDPVPGHRMYDRIKAIDAHRAELRREMVLELVALLAYFSLCWSQHGLIKGICVQMSIYTISSLHFSLFTQVSHLQEECFVDKQESKNLSFARRMVTTSVDYATDSAFWCHMSSGLNTQSLHHCFPAVSAIHLRALYPGFRKVCKEHRVLLKEASSLTHVVWGFLQFSN